VAIRWAQIIAVGAILIFSLSTAPESAFGGRVQTILTFSKVLGISSSSSAFWLSRAASRGKIWLWSCDAKSDRVAGRRRGDARRALAYDGWNNMPMAAGEIENPGRNVPRALIFGMAVVLTVIF
jgi:APA family basic amino acid/polyamine antiporter